MHPITYSASERAYWYYGPGHLAPVMVSNEGILDKGPGRKAGFFKLNLYSLPRWSLPRTFPHSPTHLDI